MSDAQIDLHCHSTASDGRLSPTQVVEKAAGLGLKALALTDHDTVGGIEEFLKAGRSAGLETIPGVEVSAQFAKGTMHIVGLFVDPAHGEFRAFLKKLADGRKIRNPQIVKKLNEQGVQITMAEVEEEAGLRDDGPGGGAIDKSVGRPHIASLLIKKGYVKDKQEAFDKYLAKGASCYVTRFVASPKESIAMIHAAGGVAILAHPPYLKADDDADMERIVGGLRAEGLDGIEVHYSTHTPEQTALCARLAEKYDLAPSGGSDFHGEPAGGRDGKTVELGTGIGRNLRIPYAVLENLKARAKR